jgi:hypothetical protein
LNRFSSFPRIFLIVNILHRSFSYGHPDQRLSWAFHFAVYVSKKGGFRLAQSHPQENNAREPFT